MLATRSSVLLASTIALASAPALAQTTFGASCAGASGVTPELTVTGLVESGSTWTLEVTAPGGLGIGYLLIGFSNTTSSFLGGVPLPLDLGTFFADPLWSGCPLNVDPSFLIQPYTFDPNSGGGVSSNSLPGFDGGDLFVQALNVDPDFTTRIAGVSEGLVVRGGGQLVDGMVAIAPGTFTMGSDAASGPPYFGQSNETPHLVTISYPFWMNETEVTQAEYAAVMGSNPSFFVGPNRPVERVSWFDAMAYCQALTAIESAAGNVPEGYEYRLPTEAEWEYACRAGTTTEYGVGALTELDCTDGRFAYSYHSSTLCSNPTGTADVGSYAPNAWQLFDMHGNVWEWCLDSWSLYPTEPVTDPFVTGGVIKLLRGGGWTYDSPYCRSAFRVVSGATDATGDNAGFRVVLGPTYGI